MRRAQILSALMLALLIFAAASPASAQQVPLQDKPFADHVHLFTPQQTHVTSNTSNEDPYVALHEAFSHVERMLVEANGNDKHRSQS